MTAGNQHVPAIPRAAATQACPGGNLWNMTQDFDEARRQAVARGWATSPLDQKTYAAQNGISARTLREWVRRYGVGDRPAARALAIIDTAIDQLRALRAALVAEEARHAGGDCEEVPEKERHAAAVADRAGPGPPLDHRALVPAPTDRDQQQAVRPVSFADPWSRGGGFLGPF